MTCLVRAAHSPPGSTHNIHELCSYSVHDFTRQTCAIIAAVSENVEYSVHCTMRLQQARHAWSSSALKSDANTCSATRNALRTNERIAPRKKTLYCCAAPKRSLHHLPGLLSSHITHTQQRFRPSTRAFVTKIQRRLYSNIFPPHTTPRGLSISHWLQGI